MFLTILDLLPQSPNFLLSSRAQKLNILKFVYFIICHVKKAFELFYHKKVLIEFDAHVGETLCQIRAYKLYLMSKQPLYEEQLTDQLDKIIESEKNCLNTINNFEKLKFQCPGKYNKILDHSIPLNDFLYYNHIIFNISEDLHFLSQCLILTKFSMKDFFGISLAIDYEKLALELNCGKTLSRSLARLYQSNLSHDSCKFILSLFNNLPHFQNLAPALTGLLQTDNHKRNVLPCYEISKALFNHMFYSKCPILLLIIQQSETEQSINEALFIPRNGEYIREKDLTTFNTSFCFIIKGVTYYNSSIIPESPTELLKRIEQFGIKNIFLSNMAKHPQYSAKELEEKSENPYKQASVDDKNQTIAFLQPLEEEYLTMKNMAENIGCCQSNQSLFFVKHIFIDTLENQLKRNVSLSTISDVC